MILQAKAGKRKQSSHTKGKECYFRNIKSKVITKYRTGYCSQDSKTTIDYRSSIYYICHKLKHHRLRKIHLKIYFIKGLTEEAHHNNSNDLH